MINKQQWLEWCVSSAPHQHHLPPCRQCQGTDKHAARQCERRSWGHFYQSLGTRQYCCDNNVFRPQSCYCNIPTFFEATPSRHRDLNIVRNCWSRFCCREAKKLSPAQLCILLFAARGNNPAFFSTPASPESLQWVNFCKNLTRPNISLP